MSKVIRKINKTNCMQMLSGFCNYKVLEERETITGKRFYLVDFGRALSSDEEKYLEDEIYHGRGYWSKLSVIGRWAWAAHEEMKRIMDDDPSYTQGYRDGNTGLRWL